MPYNRLVGIFKGAARLCETLLETLGNEASILVAKTPEDKIRILCANEQVLYPWFTLTLLLVIFSVLLSL
jgi:hypothetical protein